MIYGAILAGGTGERLNVGMPKQFLKIGEKPILVYSIETFLSVEEFDLIIISSPKEYIRETENLVYQYFGDNEKLRVIQGGKTRNDTILNSIKCCELIDDSIMVTHDAARIFVSSDQIKKSIYYCKDYFAACPVIPSTDVIFKSTEKGKLDEVPLRKNLVRAQTPQAFKINKFLEIYHDLTENEIQLLDEAMVLFHLRNEPVYLFEGESINFKITRPFDVEVAKTILK